MQFHRMLACDHGRIKSTDSEQREPSLAMSFGIEIGFVNAVRCQKVSESVGPFFYFYPNNNSLAEDLKRLFTVKLEVKNNEAEEDDWHWNGVEVDPQLDQWIMPMGRPLLKRQKKSKKVLPTECVFCKNNREEPEYYKNHILKDLNGKIRCPILRAYTCPICGLNGDKAHTVKYCPNNNGQIASMGGLKTMRTSTGIRRAS